MNQTDVSAHNAALFETPESVQDYAGEGLWPVEAGLIGDVFPRPPAAILDIGCGTGRTTAGLVSSGYQVVAVDLSASMISRARSLHPACDFRVMDASRLTFDEQSFDGALFSFNGIDLIYPEDARMACLRHVRRVLRAGAGFVLSTHSVLGHVLCGRPFGTGTWRYAGRFVADQLRNPLRSERYYRIREGDRGRYLWTYAALPATTERQLAAAGFGDISIRTLNGDDRIGWLGSRTVHTYFGARRR